MATALREFKREKLNKQNARLSLVNSMYDNPSMPKRKIMLSVGGTNYRPPLERSKSAPKLMAIEEAIGEEDEDEASIEILGSIKTVPESKPMSRSQYQTLTLGRQRGLKSIRRRRRVEKIHPSLSHEEIPIQSSPMIGTNENEFNENLNEQEITISDEEFEKFLQRQDAACDKFSGELFDYLKTHFEDTSSNNNLLLPSIEPTSEPNTFRQDEVISYLTSFATSARELNGESNTDGQDVLDYNSSGSETCQQVDQENCQNFEKENNKKSHQFDSDTDDLSAPPSFICVTNKTTSNGTVEGEGDAGSISSGCETASTITNIADESSQKPCSVLERIRSFEKLSELPKKPIITPRRRHVSTCLVRTEVKENFQRSVSVPTPGTRNRSKYAIQHTSDICTNTNLQPLDNNLESIDSDSDESGYVEYQETGLCNKK